MAKDCKLPELGENITSATVLEVLVAVGDTIEADQSILSLESDKAEFELPSPCAGKVSEILVSAGDDVEVGQVVLRVDGEDADGDEAEGEDADGEDTGADRDEEPEATERKKPASKKPPASAGDKPKKTARSDDAATAESDDGAGEGTRRDEPEEREESDDGAGDDKEEPKRRARTGKEKEEKEKGKKEEKGKETTDDRTPVAAAPSVRRLARELGIDVGDITGTAQSGRVSTEDVYRFVRRKLAAAGEEGRARSAGTQDYSHWGKTEAEPMSKVRRRTADQMSLAWSSIPHVNHQDRADITDLDRLRGQFAPRVEKAGGKLTITAVLLKVVGSALRRYPKFNASVDMEANEIVYKKFVNVGVAVDTERGLLVPVIRDVDEKNIVELSLELRDLSEAARNRKLTPDRLQGATFTVTNLGGIGGVSFTPLINPPEVAVLGVSRASHEPVWDGKQFEPRLMLPLSVTYDHRVIDGADAARFLRWVCEALKEPFLMDLEGD